MVAFQTIPVVGNEYSARGDFNGDGFIDYAVGDWEFDESASTYRSGRVLIYPTHTRGEVPHHTPELVLRPGDGAIPGVGTTEGRFGYALATGDFNGDGYDDLAIGMPGIAGSAQTYGGAIYLVYGSSNGLQTSSAHRMQQGQDGVWGTYEGGDGFGHALVADDFDLDGYDDLGVGAPFEHWGSVSQVGVVHVLRGAATGLTGQNDVLFHRNLSTIDGSRTSGDRFGYSLASGRLAGPHYPPRLAIGAPGVDGAVASSGAVFVVMDGLNTSSVAVRLDESLPEVGSSEAYGEGFGHAITMRDDDQDEQDDLVVENLFGTDCTPGGATHLFYGGPLFFDLNRSEYKCEAEHEPRFHVEVDGPQKPAPYVAPTNPDVVVVPLQDGICNAQPPLETCDLATALRNTTPTTIVLEDGVYDYTGSINVNVNAAHKIWARHVGAAVVRFGWQLLDQNGGAGSTEIHGVTFDMSIEDPGRVHGDASNSAILFAGQFHVSDTLIEDSFFYGHDWIDHAISSNAPTGFTLRRLVSRDTHVSGFRLSIANSVVLEDLDVAHVARPAGEAGGSANHAVPSPNYYCDSESAIILDEVAHADLDRIRVRDTRCGGINLGVNEDEQSNDGGTVTNVDIDFAGFGPETLTSFGNMKPVRNAGLYFQEASNMIVHNVVVGHYTYHGIRSEWVHENNNEGLLIYSVLLQSQHVGIAWDACTIGSLARSVFIEGAYCAGIIDNYGPNDEQSPVEPSDPNSKLTDNCKPGTPVTKGSPNTIGGNLYNRPINDDTENFYEFISPYFEDDDDHDVWHYNANICPTDFVPDYPPGADHGTTSAKLELPEFPIIIEANHADVANYTYALGGETVGVEDLADVVSYTAGLAAGAAGTTEAAALNWLNYAIATQSIDAARNKGLKVWASLPWYGEAADTIWVEGQPVTVPQLPDPHPGLSEAFTDFWAERAAIFMNAVDAYDTDDTVVAWRGLDEVRYWVDEDVRLGRRMRELVQSEAGNRRTLMAYTGGAYMPNLGLVGSLIDPAYSAALAPYNPHSVMLSPSSPVARDADNGVVGPFYPLTVDVNLDATQAVRPMFEHIIAGAYTGLALRDQGHQNRIWTYHRSRISHEARENVETVYQSLAQQAPHHLVFHAPDLSEEGVLHMSLEEAQHDFWAGMHHAEGVYIYNLAYRDVNPSVWDAYARALFLIKSEMKPSLRPSLRWTPSYTSNGAVQTVPADDYLPLIVNGNSLSDRDDMALPDGADAYATLNVSMAGANGVYYAIATNSWNQPADFTFDVPGCITTVDVVYGTSPNATFVGNQVSDSFTGINGRVYRIQSAPCSP